MGAGLLLATAAVGATGLALLAWAAARHLRTLRARGRELEERYAELREAQARLVEAGKLATLGQLVAGVAHEINTPIGALASNQETLVHSLRRLGAILEDEVVDASELEELRRVVRTIGPVMEVNEMAVERLATLVESLRTFGRPDRAQVDRVELHDSVESSLAILAHRLGGIEVVREYAELPAVECYPQELNQVFMNLLLNAVQAMEGGGTLTVRTARAGGEEVAVEVADTGPGIDPALQERIFEPGFSTKGSRVGMGLGLLIARETVRRHGGRITVRSLPGQGATFRVVLPLRLPPPSAGEADRGVGAGLPQPGYDP